MSFSKQRVSSTKDPRLTHVIGQSEHQTVRDPLLLIIPVFNDWDTAFRLLSRLDITLSQHSMTARVILVDDGSTEASPSNASGLELTVLTEIRILRLRRNLGHQRALAIGMAWVEQHLPQHTVLIMDADGEDAPEDIPRLLEKMEESSSGKIIFAERTLRSEGPLFRFSYLCYRTLHFLLTGRKIRFGNFSVIPRNCLPRLVVVSEIWNHYAAAVVKSRIPFDTIATHRRKRISGNSKMSFASLITHGLSALSVQGDIIGVRLLIGSAIACASAVIFLALLVGMRFITHWAVPGWYATAAGVTLIVLIQILSLSLFFSFLTLQGRANTSFIPIRDYSYFLLDEILLQTDTANRLNQIRAL